MLPTHVIVLTAGGFKCKSVQCNASNKHFYPLIDTCQDLACQDLVCALKDVLWKMIKTIQGKHKVKKAANVLLTSTNILEL